MSFVLPAQAHPTDAWRFSRELLIDQNIVIMTFTRNIRIWTACHSPLHTSSDPCTVYFIYDWRVAATSRVLRNITAGRCGTNVSALPQI